MKNEKWKIKTGLKVGIFRTTYPKDANTCIRFAMDTKGLCGGDEKIYSRLYDPKYLICNYSFMEKQMRNCMSRKSELWWDEFDYTSEQEGLDHLMNIVLYGAPNIYV